MKKIFFILCFIWLSITGLAQNDSVIKFQNIIQSFENKEGATTITIAKPMFGLIGKMIKSDELQNIQPLLSQVNSVKMLIIDKDTNIREFKQSIRNNEVYYMLNRSLR